jgi:hypothetical protein
MSFAAFQPLALTHLAPVGGGNGLGVSELMILPSTTLGTSLVFSVLHPIYDMP